MLSFDYISLLKKLLLQEGVSTYSMEPFSLFTSNSKANQLSNSYRVYYLLLPQNIPTGSLLISENRCTRFTDNWQDSAGNFLELYEGQIALELPEGESMNQLKLLRIIPLFDEHRNC